jgi:hypothetical protein
MIGTKFLCGIFLLFFYRYNPSEEAFRNAWGFEPLINLHLLPPSFPRHTPVTLDSGTFIFFGKLCHQLKLVGLLRDKLKSMEGLMYFLRTEGSALDLALTRYSRLNLRPRSV